MDEDSATLAGFALQSPGPMAPDALRGLWTLHYVGRWAGERSHDSRPRGQCPESIMDVAFDTVKVTCLRRQAGLRPISTPVLNQEAPLQQGLKQSRKLSS